MKWPFVLVLFLLLIKICITKTFQYHTFKTNGRKRLQNVQIKFKHDNHEYGIAPSTYNEKGQWQQEQHRFRNKETKHKQQETEVNTNYIPLIEIDMPQCPQGCVCQYAHLIDLPISRWINLMQQKHSTSKQNEKNEINVTDINSFNRDNSDIEMPLEGDHGYVTNPLIKQATCIIQEDTSTDQLINSLPNDMQALILLYTGVGKNKTVNSSVLKPLNRLTTLEVRGPNDRSLRFLIDDPLSFLQYVNFESITLIGSELYKKPKNLVHPKEKFDYKPNIELLNSFEFNVQDDKNIKHYDKKILFELQKQEQEELEIVPYEVYKEEVKKAQMPSFYGWKNLEILRIQSCGLSELSWEMFMGLEELEHLSLERNDIAVVPPFALSGATQLKTLSLAHNFIHDLHYRSLAGLFKLKVLDLNDNYLMKLTELSFPPLPKLERIDFRHNPLRYIFPATFWIMNQTQEMYFGSSETALELWGNQPFKKLINLKILEINNVTIQNLDQNIFKDLKSLKKLKLRGELGAVEFDAFAGVPKLEELDLSNCHIKDISMDAFIGCRNLKIINLANNNISYIPPGLLDDQQSLEEIYLNDNQLNTLPKTFFQQKKLLLARLNNNPWKCTCDMLNWKAKVTNQEKGPAIERCVNDFVTGKKLACRGINNFKFNKNLAPRCDNFKGRSVYYVIRKQIQCSKKYIDLRVVSHQRLPHWLKIGENIQRSVKVASPTVKKNINNTSMMWPLQKNDMHENSLRYQVLKTFAEKTEFNVTNNNLELSNDT